MAPINPTKSNWWCCIKPVADIVLLYKVPLKAYIHTSIKSYTGLMFTKSEDCSGGLLNIEKIDQQKLINMLPNSLHDG
ncbi:MAG: hypothetical protein CMIDDMOC_00483 [Sodalis sp. Fle]|nr:MAG: hypothetical protein CMIDDMOC_00483 [Sodalis sp. Fle]